MAKSAIFQAIEDQRAAIDRGEKEMLRELTRQWMPARDLLAKRITELTDYINAEHEAGRGVQVSYLYALDRYKIMMEEAEQAVKSYNYAIRGLITGAEADAVNIGAENARNIMEIVEPDDPMWTRINKRETRIMSGMLSEPSPLSTLLNASWPETRAGLDSVLLAGISTGQGPEWIASRLKNAFDVPLKRALTIARTETNRAYRAANLETMRSSRVVKGYRRVCYKPTACFACLMLDGEYYDKKEDFSDHPNGKCAAVPVTRHFDPGDDPDWQKGADWFENDLTADEQRSIMGDGRYELWKEDGIDPTDMVYIKQNKLWGGSPTVYSLEKLKNMV